MSVLDAFGVMVGPMFVGRCPHYPADCGYEAKPHRALRIVLAAVQRHLNRKHSENTDGYVVDGLMQFANRHIVTLRPLNRWERTSHTSAITSSSGGTGGSK